MRITNMIKSTKEALAIKPFHSSSMHASEQQEQNQRLLRFVMASAVCLLALEPSVAMAIDSITLKDTSDGGALGTVAKNVLGAVTGTLGKSVAALAVVALGVMAMFGKLAWDTAIKVIIGIGLVFGATSIVGWISGVDAIK